VTPRLRCPRCGAALAEPIGGDWTCAQCSATFAVVDGIPSLVAAPTDPRTNAFFDQVAASLHAGKLSYVPYDARRLDAQLGILSRAVVRALERWVPAGSTILDVGCGHGALLAPALARYRAIGVDFALGMLPFARDRGFAVYHADAAALPFGDDQFDAVVCTEVVQQYDDERPVLSELARVCRPGGSVIVSTLNRYSLLRAIARAVVAPLRPEAFAVPVVRRSVGDMRRDAVGLPVAFAGVGWVLSPTRLVSFGRAPASPLTPAATNFVVQFEKTGA
jgi:SAM-dependent methyltransferase